MSELKWMLGFSFSQENFVQQAQDIIETNTQRRLADIELNLRNMTARLQAIQIQIPKEVKSVHTLFVETYQRNPTDLPRIFASLQRLNLLTYALSYQPSESSVVIMNDSEMLNSALSLFQKQWSSDFWKGFLYSLLYGWHFEHKQRIQYLLSGKLKDSEELSINDENLRIRTIFEQHRQYFLHNSGAMVLGKHAAEKQWVWQNTPAEFGLPPDFLNSSYFQNSLQIYAVYLVKLENIELCFGSFSQFLNQLGSSAQTLYILSLLILSVEQFLKGATRNAWQESLSPLVQRLIGTHENEKAWTPYPSHSEIEAQKIQQARAIFGHWVMQRFFRFFFESLASDDKRNDRYKFWQQYLDYVDDFKIFVNDAQFNRMKNNPEIQPYMGSKIAKLGDSYNNVLVMMIQDFMLIEFSGSGAFYAYNRNKLPAQNIPDISKKRMRSEEFKQTELFRFGWRGLQDYLGPDKARKSHTGKKWDEDIARWLRQELNCVPRETVGANENPTKEL